MVWGLGFRELDLGVSESRGCPFWGFSFKGILFFYFEGYFPILGDAHVSYAKPQP